MTVDLDKLEQLARAATPGPWESRPEERFMVRRPGREAVQIERAELSNGELDNVDVPRIQADAAFIAAANPAAVLELVRRLRAAEAAVALAAAKLIDDPEFMSKLVDEHEKKYGDARNVERVAIVRELAASDADDVCQMCGARRYKDEPHEVDCLITRAVEAKP